MRSKMARRNDGGNRGADRSEAVGTNSISGHTIWGDEAYHVSRHQDATIAVCCGDHAGGSVAVERDGFLD